MAWLITMPVAAGLAALAYWGSTLPPEPYNGILMTLVMITLAGLLVIAVRRAPSAEDIEQETDRDHEVPMRAGPELSPAPPGYR